jgi:hypothetical protein
VSCGLDDTALLRRQWGWGTWSSEFTTLVHLIVKHPEQANKQESSKQTMKLTSSNFFWYPGLLLRACAGGEEVTLACLPWGPYAGTFWHPPPAAGLREAREGHRPSASEEEFLRLAGEETVREKWWQGVRRRRQVRKHFHLLSRGQWTPSHQGTWRPMNGPLQEGTALCALSLTSQSLARDNSA